MERWEYVSLRDIPRVFLVTLIDFKIGGKSPVRKEESVNFQHVTELLNFTVRVAYNRIIIQNKNYI